MTKRIEAHFIVGLGLIDRIDHLEHASHLSCCFHKNQCILWLKRGDGSIGANQIGQLYGNWTNPRGLQRKHERDDGVISHGGREFIHKRRNVLPLHIGKLLQIQLVLLNPQHHVLCLQKLIECGERFRQRVRARADEIHGSLGNFRFANDWQAGRATEIVKNLVP